MADQSRAQGDSMATTPDKGKGKAVETHDDLMEEEEDSDEDEEVPEDHEEEEEDDDNMEEIDQDNIVGRRTRGKDIDFAKADQELTAEGHHEDDDDDEEDEDFRDDDEHEGEDSEMRD